MTNNKLKQFKTLIFIHKITVYLLILKYIERIKERTDPNGLRTEYIYDAKEMERGLKSPLKFLVENGR